MRTRLGLLLLLAGCGDAASPAPLLYNRALAAFRAGDWRAAEEAAAEAAARADPAVAAHCDFLRACVAFARCELAERQARTPEAEPFAFDVALRYCDAAGAGWRRAATSRDDWPAARRNFERALLKRRELERAKAEAEQRRRRPPRPRPRPRPEAGEEPAPAHGPPRDAPPVAELSPEEVLRLVERLARKEQEKRAVRREERRAASAGVERDW